jgi:RimJ/RimL family protein N-acetyltransferase
MNLTIKEMHKKDREIIKSLIDKSKHNPYSNIRFYRNIDKLNDYYYELFFADKNIKVLSAVYNKEIVGLLTFFISNWDSKVFGIKMAKLGYITATGGYINELVIKKKLLSAGLKYLKDQGVKHLSVRIEANDFSSIHAIEALRFRIMDNLVTYIYRDVGLREGRFLFPEVKRWFRVRKISPEDLKFAGDLLANSGIESHYSIDRVIPSSRVRNMYRKWLECKFKNLKENDIFVVKRGKKVVGCSIFSFNLLLEKCTGLKSVHRGLVAVDPLAKGCLIALINAQIMQRKDLDFAEFETQIYNYRMMDVIQKLGMRLIRCRYTFHRTL